MAATAHGESRYPIHVRGGEDCQHQPVRPESSLRFGWEITDNAALLPERLESPPFPALYPRPGWSVNFINPGL